MENQNSAQLMMKEQNLVQELMKTKMENGQELQFEELDGYEIPPRTQFSMLSKPTVSIKNGKLIFNMACIKMFEGIKHIIPVIHEEKRRLAVIPCVEEESVSVEWARQQKDGKWKNKEITCRELVAKIGVFMKWNVDARYKIVGEVKMSARGPILVFDLAEAVLVEFIKEEMVDKNSGEKKVKRSEIKYYPDRYKGRIGMTYQDYILERQMTLFEDYSQYFGIVGNTDQGKIINEAENERNILINV